MIAVQPEPGADRRNYYAYCACGVCGPPRRQKENAERDDREHASVCSTQGRGE